MNISIHALLAESDIMYALVLANAMLFLSTLSLRRATRVCQGNKFRQCHFYPRSPCGERHSANCNYHNAHPISIHALLAESDFRPSY